LSLTDGRWRIGDDTLVVVDPPTLSGTNVAGLRAFDLTTGPLRWTATGQFDFRARIAVRDGMVFVTRTSDTQARVFDLAGRRGCSGSPVVCTPFRVLDVGAATAPGLAVGSALTAVARATPVANTDTSRRSFALYPTDCSASPCPPVATTAPVTGFTVGHDMPPTLTANLLLAVRQPSGFGAQTYHLVAYDASLASGCSGTPKVCAPVADVPIASLNDAPEPVVAWDGRVYVNVNEGFSGRVYVLALPGDVK